MLRNALLLITSMMFGILTACSSTEESTEPAASDDMSYSSSESMDSEDDGEEIQPEPYGSANSSAMSEPAEQQDSYPDDDYNGAPEPLISTDLGEPKATGSLGFRNGFYRFLKNCNIRKSPSSKSPKVGLVPHNKRLWVEGHNSKWLKVFKKSGVAYVSSSCIE